MSNVIAIVMLSGASCFSHVGHLDALKMTVATKTPCAVVIREPVGNPFKAAQEPNKVTAAKPAAKVAYKYPPPKKKKPRKKKKGRK